MLLSIPEALFGTALTAVLAGLAVWLGALTARAGLVAFVFGAVIVGVGGFAYLALVSVFLVASVLATRYRFEEKRRSNVQEGTHGERGVSNVVSHILVPTALVLANLAAPASLTAARLGVLYTSALAFGSADTFASEFGVLAGHARSILTGRAVTPGTSGGISAAGTGWAAVGAIATAGLGFVLLWLFAVPTVHPYLFLSIAAGAGFLGCQIDSVVGETLENRGWLTKGGTNFVSMAATVAVAAGLLVAVGGGP